MPKYVLKAGEEVCQVILLSESGDDTMVVPFQFRVDFFKKKYRYRTKKR